MNSTQLPKELQFIVNGRRTQHRTTARMDGKTCVITGTTSGVGLAAAKRIAQGGANLGLVNRNHDKALKVKEEIQGEHGSNIDLIQADLSNLIEVREAAKQILDKHLRIDVLVHNAGIHNNSRQLTNGIEMVFCVNHLASFLLTQLLLDRLKESSPSTILYVNSQGHRFGGLDLNDLNWEKRRYSGYQSYGASKTAQLMTIWELSDQLEGTGITINAMHPGGVITNIGMNNGFLYRCYQRFLIFPFLSAPDISGEAIYYLIAAPEMKNVTGKFYNQTIEEEPASQALDREKGKQVWNISKDLTGLGSEEVIKAE